MKRNNKLEKRKKKILAKIGIINLSTYPNRSHHNLYIHFENRFSLGKIAEHINKLNFIVDFNGFARLSPNAQFYLYKHKNGATLIFQVPETCTNIRLHIAQRLTD